MMFGDLLDYVDIVGFVAGALTAFAYVPQVIKSMRSKSTKDLSLWWIAISVVGPALWEIYGLVILSYPLIFTNLVSLVMAMYMLYLKTKHG